MSLLKFLNQCSGKELIRVSVISDNAELSKFFFQQIKKTLIRNSKIQVKIFNSFPESRFHLDYIHFVSNIDLKDDWEVDKLIANSDFVFSLHCKQIFPKKLVESKICINIHPGYNPFNLGWYPQVFSIINGLPAGVTIHLMNEKIDSGGIIAQREIKIKEHENSFDAYRKIIEIEKQLIVENLGLILNRNFMVQSPTSNSNLNLKKDFDNLCKLNLDSTGSLREHINLLRATTHGSFRNSYFVGLNGQEVLNQNCN